MCVKPVLINQINLPIALLRDKTHSTKSSKQVLKTTCSQVRKLARRCANNYWLELSQDIQSAAETGKIWSINEGIKKTTSPASKKTAPLKDLNGNVILCKNKQMERWVEHYSELYSWETRWPMLPSRPWRLYQPRQISMSYHQWMNWFQQSNPCL